MKEKLGLFIASIWTILVGLRSPFYIGSTFMCITGHSKGYDYDLGSEKDISILWGCILLIIWLIAILPTIFLCKKLYEKKKSYALIPIIAFTICFFIGILLMGDMSWNAGFTKFIEFFGF